MDRIDGMFLAANFSKFQHRKALSKVLDYDNRRKPKGVRNQKNAGISWRRYRSNRMPEPMSHYEHLLDVLSDISGIIGFVWIGLRSDLKCFGKAWSKIRKEPAKSWNYFSLLSAVLPYVFFAFTAVVLIFQERRLEVRNSIMTVQGDDGNEIPVRRDLEVISTNADFHVTICGSIDQASATSLISRYGGKNGLSVYAVVSESLRGDDPKPLAWVQGNAGCALAPGGEYKVQAYLGGTGIYSAHSGQIFPVRIYIPKQQNIDFKVRSQYPNVDDLPAPAYVSEPIYIECKR